MGVSDDGAAGADAGGILQCLNQPRPGSEQTIP